MNKKVTGGIVTGVGLLGCLILGIMSIEIIPQGHVGVVWSQASGVQEHVLGEGWTVVNPIHRVIAFPVSTETVNVDTFNVLTRDGKSLGIKLAYDYSSDAEMVTDIFTKFRGQTPQSIEAGWLEDRVQRAVLNVFSKYSVLDVFQNLANIQVEVFEEFRDLVGDYGFNVSAVTVQAPDMDESTREMIQQVVDSQLKLEQLEFERQQAIVEADTRIEQARGRAESTLIEAEAEAEANELLQNSLTDELIISQWIEAWNGELPLVSGEGNYFIDINALMNAE